MSSRDSSVEGGYGEEGRTREEQDRAAEGGDDPKKNSVEPKVPEAAAAQDELVDNASDESFPASDPPSYWQRETDEASRQRPTKAAADTPSKGSNN